MGTKGNVSQAQSLLEALIQLCENATISHNVLIPLLPEDEQRKQNEWFSSIMKYCDTFTGDVEKWLNESEDLLHDDNFVQPEPVEMNEQVSSLPAADEPQVPMHAVPIIKANDMQDDIKPSDSVSNVASRTSRTQTSASGRSAASSISSAHLRAEADLAALKIRQKLLKEKHELEEEEERLRKRKEQLKLDEEIAAHMAKLNVFRSQSSTSGKSSGISKHSDGMNFYLEQAQGKAQTHSAKAKPFVPQTSHKETKQDCLDTGARLKKKNPSQFIHSKYVSPIYHETEQSSAARPRECTNTIWKCLKCKYQFRK